MVYCTRLYFSYVTLQGRAPILGGFDMESTVFAGKTLLITGGTGSFGNTVLKHFLSTDIGEIRIFSRDEKKQDDMRHDYQLKYPELSGKIKFYIGDVRNPDSLRGVMRGVDYIFHAAALKQVPSCEFFPMEAVRTNVLGTDNVLTAAIDAGVKKVVCLSTDKAAYPINAMGISKAMMELFGETGTHIIGTRHGEKLYETLLTREEKTRSEDLGGYYRVAADGRDLNYDKYFVNGEVRTQAPEDYTSHNTRRLTVDEVVDKLLSLEYVKEELAALGK